MLFRSVAASPTSPYVTPLGLCKLYSFPRPRIVSASPPSPPIVEPAPRRKGKEKALPSLPAWVDDDENGASVRRVMRKNKESQLERALWSEEGRKRGNRGRSESAKRGYESDGGSRRVGESVGKRKEERKKAREESAGRKDEGDEGDVVERLRSVPVGEGGRMGAAWVRDVRPTASPPTAHSFDPFANIVGHIRKLSISKSRERRISTNGESTLEWASPSPPQLKPLFGGGRQRRASAAQALQQPKMVGNKPIRHFRSDSVDSLYPPPNASTRRTAVDIGTALSGAQMTPAEPAPTLQTQNAFLSLPPHLHHLLRQPNSPGADTSFIPSRHPPPIPSAPGFSSAHAREQRNSGASADSDAALVIALDHKFRTEENEQLRSESIPTSSSSTTITPTAAPTPLRPRGSFGRSLPIPPRRRKTSPSHADSSTLRRRRLGEPADIPLWTGSTRGSHDPTATPTLGGNGDEVGAYFDRPLTAIESPVVRSPLFRPARSSSSEEERNEELSMKSPSSWISHQSHGSSGQRSILNLDEEGSNFQDLVRAFLVAIRDLALIKRKQFFRPPPSPDGVQRARAQRLSISTIVSSEEGATLPSGSTHGEISRSPVLFQERRHLTLSHEVDQYARAPDSRRTTDVLDTPRAEELDKLFAHIIQHAAEVEMSELGGGEERTRPSTADSGVESEAWATAEDGDWMRGDELPEVEVRTPRFDEQQFDLPRHLASALRERPRPSPTQGSWAATSFGREYFGAEDDYEESNVAPLPGHSSRVYSGAEKLEDYDTSNVLPIPFGLNVASAPRSAESGRSSFLDFTWTGTPPNETKPTDVLRRSSAQSSFLDFEGPPQRGQSSQDSFLDWTPPNSPTVRLLSALRVATVPDPIVRHSQGTSLKDPYRDSYLSVNSFNRSPHQADLSSGTERSSYGSSPGSRVSGMSNLSLGSHLSHLVADFPDPPTQARGALEYEDLEEEEEEEEEEDRKSVV